MDKIDYKQIKISSDYITLGQLLKFAHVIVNGGEAKSFILSHNILVNDEDNKQRGKKLYPGYKVAIDNSLFFEIVK
ncbi:MAG: RNA-binding S4 domain-containing protein [Bacilli bacterium]